MIKFSPQPKNKRIVDRLAVLRVRVYAKNICEYSGKYGDIEVHHIVSRGAGGDDVEENLIALNYEVHNLAQEYQIEPARLKEIAQARADKIRKMFAGYSERQLQRELRAYR